MGFAQGGFSGIAGFAQLEEGYTFQAGIPILKSALRINGVMVDVMNASPSRTIINDADTSRSYRRQLRDPRRFARRQTEVTLAPMEPDSAYGFERFIQGEGHFMELRSSLWADGGTGLGPCAGYKNIIFVPSGIGAYKNGYCQWTNIQNVVVAYDAQLQEDWFVYCRVWYNSGWRGFIARSSGECYLDGSQQVNGNTVAGSSIGFTIRVVGGVVEIVSHTNSETRICDLFIAPYRCSDELGEVLSASITNTINQIGPCPLVRVSGDLVSSNAVLCFVSDVYVDIIGAPVGQSLLFNKWRQNAKVIKFKLTEIIPFETMR